MNPHYTLIIAVIIIIVCIQFGFFINTWVKRNILKNIFPPRLNQYNVDISEEDDNIQSISTKHDNPVLKTIFDSINHYLVKNRGAVSDFHLIKDIVDRNCDAKEEEINVQIPVPLYLGLIGTMAGILIGVGFLIFGGDLDALLNGDSKRGGEGVSTLLGGVALAMISSIIGIALTTISSLLTKSGKSNVEKNKNTFFSWIQAELLPLLSTDTANTLKMLTGNLTKFNTTFSNNTRELRDTLSEVNVSYRSQAELMEAINRLNIRDIASANISVLKELQGATDEIATFNTYLHSVNGYVARVQELNENLNAHLNRTKAIEDMGTFFKDEIEQIELRKGSISRSVGAVDDTLSRALSVLQENVSEQFNQLTKSTITLHEGFEKVVEEQQETLQKKLQETSEILTELKNLTAVKSSMSNLEKATNVQNKKIEDLTTAIKALAEQKATGRTVITIPLWLKAGVFLLFITSIAVLLKVIISFFPF